MKRIVYALGLRGFFLVLCACGGQAALLPSQTAEPSTHGTSRTLALPNHPSSSQIFGINDAGDIAVDAGDGSTTEAYIGHLPYAQRDFKREEVPGAVTTTVTAVNNKGIVAGFYSDGKGIVAAFTKNDRVWTRYPGPSNIVEYLGINDAGATVGFYTDGRGINHAFEHDAKTGKLVHLRPAGGVSVVASAINQDGDVVGYMTTSHKGVEGFLWKAGRFTKLSYPGATATKALGISKNGRIVGTYDDASGKTYGFILRDAAASPQWKTFDEPKARGFTVLTGINARGDLVGYYRDGESHLQAITCCVLKEHSGSAPPLVIPVWGYGGDSQDTDPGATPDQHLFGAIIDNSANSSSKLAANCPGVSSSSTCQPYKYVNVFMDHCSTPVTLAAYKWADANDETAFEHVYPNEQTLGNRIVFNATPNPSGPNCKPDNPNAIMRMDLGDSAFNSYLYNNVWSGSSYQNDFPAPYGVFEDQTSVFAGITVGGGGSGAQVSTEYGSGISPSGFANAVGKSSYHDPTDWETAIGTFINGACRAKCLNVGFNGVATGAGDVGPCKIISNGHCHGQYQSGEIDDQAAIDNICATVTGGNLAYFLAERPIFGSWFGFGFRNTQTMVVEINTAANLYSHTSDGCAQTKIVDLEVSYGPGGKGDVTGGHQVRLAALAYRWLVPNPSTGIPDRVVSMQYTEGLTMTEVPYFFEDTLVPVGAETAVPKFVWNGSVQTVGGGCPSAHGDSGGAVALLAQCVGSAGIYCQQYQDLYINGADYGKAAACLNTSTTPENIASSWFTHDPISSYQYELSLQGGEMTSVPYAGVPGGTIQLPTCTNTTYCTGSSSLATQTVPFKGDGSDTLCGSCGVILLAANQ